LSPAIRRFSKAFLLVLAAVGCPRAASAVKTDTVILVNGDRITGEVKALSRGKLDYSTDDAGRLSIEWERVTRIQSPNPFEVEMGSGMKYFGKLENGEADGTVVIRDTTAVTVRIPDVVAITPLNASLLLRTRGFLDVGFTLAKANKATTFSLSGETDYRGPKLGTRLAFDSYAQGQESSPTVTRNAGQLTLAWFLPKRWSAFGLGAVEQNDELDLDVRYTGGGGMARVLQKSNRSDISAAAGLVATRERFDVGGDSTSAVDESSNLEGLLLLGWNAYQFNTPKLDFSTTLELFPSLSEAGRVRGELNLRIKYELFPDFDVGIKLTDTFDSKPPEESISKNDYVTTLTIGWSYRR
jgi:hypothetical protein